MKRTNLPLIKEGARHVLVFEEKHGNHYFVILSQAELEAACLKVLTDRFNEDFWYYEPLAPTESPSYSKEEIVNLKGEAKIAAQREYNRWAARNRDYLHDKEIWDLIKTAIELKNGDLAYQALNLRRDYEYEGFSLILAEN